LCFGHSAGDGLAALCNRHAVDNYRINQSRRESIARLVVIGREWLVNPDRDKRAGSDGQLRWRRTVLLLRRWTVLLLLRRWRTVLLRRSFRPLPIASDWRSVLIERTALRDIWFRPGRAVRLWIGLLYGRRRFFGSPPSTARRLILRE
jgi:hypothetical protein